MHLSHEELMRSSDKKEKLERAIRYKLEIDARRLYQQNRDLKSILLFLRSELMSNLIDL